MLEQSRRSFIRLGSLVIAGPLIGELIPISTELAASPGQIADSLVTVRVRVIPELGGAQAGDLARVIPIAWAQKGPALYDTAQLALHDSLRELMEGVAPSTPIGRREPPSSPVAWYAQMFFTSWQLQGVSRDKVNEVERRVFESIDQDRALRAKGGLYTNAVQSRLWSAAADLGSSVETKTQFIVRLDSPHEYKWTSARADLRDPSTAHDVIANHLTKSVPSRIADYVSNDPQRVARTMTAAAATLSVFRDAPPHVRKPLWVQAFDEAR